MLYTKCLLVAAKPTPWEHAVRLQVRLSDWPKLLRWGVFSKTKLCKSLSN